MSLTTIQKLQIRSLSICDPFNPIWMMFKKLKIIVWETRELFFRNSQFMFLKDLHTVRLIVDRRINEEIGHKVREISCFFFGNPCPNEDGAYPTRTLNINVRILCGVTQIRYLSRWE